MSLEPLPDHTPANREAEVAVLAASLASKLARDEARATITGQDFYWGNHQAVWEAMSRLDRHQRTVDPVTLNAVILQDAPRAAQLLVEVTTTFAAPQSVNHHAGIVRAWAVKRRIHAEAVRTAQQALSPDLAVEGFAAGVANRFSGIRDAGSSEDITAYTLTEVLDMPDQGYDWLVPGLLEKGDRLILTGEEGLGKSSTLRQIAVMAAAGLHPFTGKPIDPLRAVIYDSENSLRQIQRKIRPLVTHSLIRGQNPSDRVVIDTPGRLDLLRDRDLARIHKLLDSALPDLMVIGPMYRLTPRAIQTDDEASPLLAALDTIRDRGIALLIEAHAGHTIGKGGNRDLRPRGSSALMGWPEFGLGMRDVGGGCCDLQTWRGSRDERDWPTRMKRAEHMTWQSVDERWEDIA